MAGVCDGGCLWTFVCKSAYPFRAVSPRSHVDASRPSSSHSPPEERRQALPRQLMMMIYTWNEDVWLPFKLRWFSGKLHLPMRSVTTSGIDAVRLSQCSNSQYKVATNMFLSTAKWFCKFKLRHFQRHPLGNRNLDQSLLEMSHPSLLSPLARKISQFLWWIRFSPQRLSMFWVTLFA